MSDMEVEAHVFPADVEHARGTRCERCGIAWQARTAMTCSAGLAYLAEHGVPSSPEERGSDDA